MTYSVNLHHSEIVLLLDALKKASARHASFAKFYPGRSERHSAIAEGQKKLAAKLAKLQQ